MIIDNILVRDAKPEDAYQIATIHVKTWQYAYHGQMPEEYLNNLSIESRTRSWEEILSKKNPRTRNFVAVADSKILGFCSIGPSRDADASDEVGEIYAIYVASETLRQGIGTTLLSEAMKSLKGLGFRSATLWVLDTNVIGRRFYEKNHWIADGKMKTEEMSNFTLHEVRYKIELMTK